MSNELALGPKYGTLSVHTGREGIVSKAGHDLTLHVEDWAAVVTYSSDRGFEHLRLVAQVNSLKVERGDGGLKPLSDKDKATILKEALKTLHADRYPEVSYETVNVTAHNGGFGLAGLVSIAGHQQSLDATVETATTTSTRITAQASIIQSEFGVKPYTGMLGALRVRDRVDINLDLDVPDLSTLAS
jgi:polyisoprenoid-binding protein YceI